MSGLTSLGLPYCELSPDHVKFIFTGCPALSKLQSLDLHGGPDLRSEDLLVLSQSTTITSLTSLNLSHCNVTTSPVAETPPSAGFGNLEGASGASGDSAADDSAIQEEAASGSEDSGSSGLVALLSSPVVQNLTHLDLLVVEFDDPMVHSTIATSPFLSNLVSLNLKRHKIEPDAIAALAASTTLLNLTSLNLFGSNLDDKGIAQLFSPPSLLAKKLQSLNLGKCNITVSSLEVILKACPSLTELGLESNARIGPAGAAFIATHMPNLTKLDLSRCCIEDEGYLALAASTALINLRELKLGEKKARAESTIALVNSPLVANLTDLDLSFSDFGPGVVTVIAQSPSLSKLQHLMLNNVGAGDEGVIALAQSTTLMNLVSLDLSDNGIGPEGVKALCTSPVVSKLTSLNLGDNKMVASVLAAPSSTLYSLIELNLEDAGMDDDGVVQLLATPNLDQLDFLYLSQPTWLTYRPHQARFGGWL
jgi:Leucine-rich repeat (LRR) protein